MLTFTRVLGFIGAGLAGAAYVPQIWHLIRVHCSTGISRPAFGFWLASSVLVTTHAIATDAAVFMVLGTLQIVAITTILVYATKYRHSSCGGHRAISDVAQLEAPGSKGPLMEPSSNPRGRDGIRPWQDPGARRAG